MTEVTQCEEYNDPTADIVLKSNEGMLFRTHSYYLKAHRRVVLCDSYTSHRKMSVADERFRSSFPDLSLVFRDMFASTHLIDNADPNADVKPIDIDASSDVIHDFLDLISNASDSKFKTPEPFSAIFDFCDTFDCHLVITHLLLILKDSDCSFAPWGTFRIADRYSNLPLARRAISMMYQGNNPWLGGLWWVHIGTERAKEISFGYLIGLLNVLNNPRGRRDYAEMAQEFTPAE